MVHSWLDIFKSLGLQQLFKASLGFFFAKPPIYKETCETDIFGGFIEGAMRAVVVSFNTKERLGVLSNRLAILGEVVWFYVDKVVALKFISMHKTKKNI